MRHACMEGKGSVQELMMILSPPRPSHCSPARSLSVKIVGLQVKYFPRVATEYLKHFAATPNLVPFLKVAGTSNYINQSVQSSLSFWASYHLSIIVRMRLTDVRMIGSLKISTNL